MTTTPMTTTPITTNATSQQRMDVALNPRRIQPILHSFAKQMALADGSTTRDPHHRRAAGCHILDAKLEPGKRGSILYEVGDALIIGELTWPTNSDRVMTNGKMTATVHLPLMQLYPFTQDPALPTLPMAMDGDAMKPLLNQHLPTCISGAERVVRCQATLLRYRLGKRCTLRYDLRLRDQRTGRYRKSTLFGKLYHDATKAEAVYYEMQRLTAKQSGSTLAMAEAVAYLPTMPMVVQAPIADNAPLEYLLLQPPTALPKQLAQVRVAIQQAAVALAELHQSTMETDRIRAVDAELIKISRRSQRIDETGTASGNGSGNGTPISFRALADALLAMRPRLVGWGEHVTVVHGDCKPSQFFQLGYGSMAILDFDHCGMADPAADVGNFLATLRQMGVKQQLKERDPVLVRAWCDWLATLEASFLDAYLASCPADRQLRQRALWYQAMALLRKAIRSFARSTRSPLPASLVQEAWQVYRLIEN